MWKYAPHANLKKRYYASVCFYIIRDHRPALFFVTVCLYICVLFRDTGSNVRWHKKIVITKNRKTSKIFFRWTQHISYTRSSLFSRHLQCFKSVLQNLLVSLALKKCAPNQHPALQSHLDPACKVLEDPPHSSLGIAFVAAVIAAFRSG